MPETRTHASHAHRWAVLPVALTAWIGLAATGGVANAAAPTDPPPASTQGLTHGLGLQVETGVVAVDTAATPVTGPDHSSGTAGTSGDATQPQPLSNADQNPGGANNGGDCGAYCSTRDGSPSMNGNGDGAATGKPCAGCVGRADNKNPQGQQPDGSDANNGYECDGNNGIGKSNPAHTSCTTSAGPDMETDLTPPTCQTGCAGSGESQSGGSLTPNTPDTPDTTTTVPTVEAERFVQQPPANPPVVQPMTVGRTPASPVTSPQGALPYTGSHTSALLTTGAAALLTGLLLLAVGRRRPVHS